MTTRIPQFTLDGQVKFPATALLTIASTCFRGLHSHYTSQLRLFEAANDIDRATEATECLQDVELVVKAIDPPYWHELLSKRIDHKDIPDPRLVDEHVQMANLLAMGNIPKAFWTVPEAVKRYREARLASVIKEQAEDEDVLLDILVFLAEKQERARLFSIVK